MTTPLFLLRCVQLGLHITELEYLTIGMIMDMFTEMQRDDNSDQFSYIGTQSDMDRF